MLLNLKSTLSWEVHSVHGPFSQGYGGGVYCENSNPFLSNVTISNNNSDGGGGGGIVLANSNAGLSNVIVSGNISGGIACSSSDPNFENVTISGNSGYGISIYYNSPSLTGLTIRGNSAGGIFCFSSSPILSNVTITGNTSNYGGGIYCRSNSHPVIVNSILWNDSPAEIYFNEWNEPNSITVTYSDINGGKEDVVTNVTGEVFWLEGNIDADPLFVDAENGNFTLQENSPCIDAGTAFYVYEGDTLINLSPEEYVGTAPDMGYHEYGQNILGDLNQDGSVDILDVVLLVGIILGETPTEWEAYAGDLNGDGSIDVLDVVQLVNVILGG